MPSPRSQCVGASNVLNLFTEIVQLPWSFASPTAAMPLQPGEHALVS